jgi:hypothetical protein
MIGQAIGASPASGPGLRAAPSEQTGPRPGGVPSGTAAAEQRQVKAIADQTHKAMRP